MVGLLPGTAAVVILGDALTGNVSPLLFVVSLCTASLGIAGLIYEIRTHRRAPPRAARRLGFRYRARDHRLTSGPFAVTTPKITASAAADTPDGSTSRALMWKATASTK